MRHRHTNLALRTSLIYGLVVTAWALLSNRLLDGLIPDPILAFHIHTYEDWAFIILTVAVLYSVLRRETRRREQEAARREQAEAARRASEARLSGIVGSAMDAIISIDASQRIAIFNSAAEQMFGCPAGEAIGQSLDRFIPAALRAAHSAHIRNFGQTGAAKRSMRSPGILAALRSDGTEFPIEATISHIVAAGQPLYTVIIRDISERKQAEAALRQSEARFAKTFQASPVAQAINRVSDSHFIDVNEELERLLGYRREELVEQPLLALNVFPEIDQIAEVDRDLSHHGQLHDRAMTIRTKSGELRQTMFSAVLIEIDGEDCTLTNVQDVTEAKRAEQAMQRATERLRVLANASHTFTKFGNDYQALLDQIAYTTTAALSEGCSILLLADDHERLLPAVLYDADSERTKLQLAILGDAPIHIADHSITTQVFRTQQPALIPVLDPDQLGPSTKPEIQQIAARVGMRSLIIVPLLAQGQAIGVLGLYRRAPEQPPFGQDDLSLAQSLADRAALAIENARLYASLQQSHNALEARVGERTNELRQANAELARAARLKDEFLASMSHELRTPLNSILGRSQALQEQIYGSLTTKQAEVLRGVEESGRHLLSLINDILDLSKIAAGKLDVQINPVTVVPLCRMCLQMAAQSALKKRITMTSTIDSIVDTIAADERRLKQILVNLLSNAVKFTPEGGKVGLEVRGDPERQSMTFTVWDTGIGIAAEDLPKLFQPFTQIDSRLSRQYEGTGLGLALVRQLAEAHDGSVAVESTPGQGSRFHVALPWRPAETGRAPSADPPAPAEQPQASSARAPERPRILLAEDNESNIDLIDYYLGVKGYEVVVARTGAEAIARAQAARPDAILMDIQMPGMDGLEAIRRIRADASLSCIPIVALTALAMPGDRERCLQAGADDYLTKPVSLANLVVTINRLLQREDESANAK